MSVKLDYREERRYGEPEGIGFWRGAVAAVLFAAWLWAVVLILTTS